MKKLSVFKISCYILFFSIQVLNVLIEYLYHFFAILCVLFCWFNRPTDFQIYESAFLGAYPYKILLALLVTTIIYKPLFRILHMLITPIENFYMYLQNKMLQKYNISLPLLSDTYCSFYFKSNLIVFNICSFLIVLTWYITGLILENKTSFKNDLTAILANLIFFYLPIIIINIVIAEMTKSQTVKKSKRMPTQYTSPHSKSNTDFDNMDGQQFEKFCAKLLSANGFYNIQFTPTVGDQGIDIFASNNQVRYAIQCKRYSGTVGNKAVQEAYAGSSFYNCNQAVVMTNSYFSASAKQLANRTGVILWDRDNLHTFIMNAQKL